MGDTTHTDSRSQRNRVGRRGGQLITRALSSSCRTACPLSVLPVPLVPDGHTIRQDSIGPNRTSNTAIIIPLNNPLERIMREIRRRTRVVGAFPDGNSALNLAAARLRHIAGTRWSTKRYLNMKLREQRNLTVQSA